MVGIKVLSEVELPRGGRVRVTVMTGVKPHPNITPMIIPLDWYAGAAGSIATYHLGSQVVHTSIKHINR